MKVQRRSRDILLAIRNLGARWSWAVRATSLKKCKLYGIHAVVSVYKRFACMAWNYKWKLKISNKEAVTKS